MSDIDHYSLSWVPLDVDALAPIWQALEAYAEPNFFLSWSWMSTWLLAYEPECRVLKVLYENTTIGLGLFTVRREIRHGFVCSRVLRLGQTGLQGQDQIWIEYNDMLLHRGHASQAPPLVMRWLLAQDDWDEFQLGATSVQRQAFYQVSGCQPHLKWSAPTYGVDLAGLRQRNKTYLASLSRNTRHQINRSERMYADEAELEFRVLSDVESMLALWPILAEFHEQRWGKASGFVNPGFVTFHQSLIRRAAVLGQIEFCILIHGQKTIGILYNFLYQGKVYFYLSGLACADDAKLKPGMMIHARAIQHYLDRGLDYYDFMGGAARYKQSLGQPGGELQLVSYQRPRIPLRLEHIGRHVKRWFGIKSMQGQHY